MSFKYMDRDVEIKSDTDAIDTFLSTPTKK